MTGPIAVMWMGVAPAAYARLATLTITAKMAVPRRNAALPLRMPNAIRRSQIAGTRRCRFLRPLAPFCG